MTAARIGAGTFHPPPSVLERETIQGRDRRESWQARLMVMLRRLSNDYRHLKNTHAIYSRVEIQDFLECSFEKLTSPHMRDVIVYCIQEAGFKITEREDGSLNVDISDFGESYGFTMTVVLAESSFTIHTWTEEGRRLFWFWNKPGRRAHPTLEYCNWTRDNSDKAERLWKSLWVAFGKPKRTRRRKFRRFVGYHNQTPTAHAA